MDEEFLISRPTTSGDFYRAVLETAESLGGLELRTSVFEAASVHNRLYPDITAIQLLEETQAGSYSEIIRRADELQTARHTAESKALLNPIKLGRQVIRGMLSFGRPS